MPASYHDLDWPSPINWRHLLNRGLLAWWIGIPQRGSGIRWVDLVRQRVATLTSITPSAGWVASGNGGRSLKFVSASSQWANLGTSVQPTLPATISVVAVPRAASTFAFLCGTASKLSGSIINYQGIWLQYQASGVADCGFGDNTGTAGANRRDYAGAISISANVPTHMTGCIRGQIDMSLYVNGVADTGGSYSGTASGTNAVYGSAVGSLGGRDSASVLYADAEISDVRIWNRSLSTTEAAQLYREWRAGYPTMLRRRRPVAKAPAAAASGAVRIVNGGPINHPIYGGLCAAVER